MFRFTGFRDGHCHPLFSARESNGPDIGGLSTLAEVQAQLADYLVANPACEWLDCGSFTPDLVPMGGLHRSLLDTISTTVPIVVHAADHHSIWVNSAALRAAGLLANVPSIANAYIEVDFAGVPTGIIREWDAMKLVYAHQPSPSLESDIAAILRAQERLLAGGIVAVQEAWIDQGMPESYLECAARGELKIRVNLAPRIDVADWPANLNFAKATRSSVRNLGNELLTCNTVKIFIDGVIGSCTALFHAPYQDGSKASAIWQQDDLNALALAADNAGFQLHFHAIGDAAVDQAISAIDFLDQTNGFVDRRPVIAHGEAVSFEAITRARQLGIVFCQQPAWATDGASLDQARDVIGVDAAQRMYPIASLMAGGVTVSFGSDWPVSPPEPLLGLQTAVTRMAPGSSLKPLNQYEAISASQALVAYSLNAAFQLGQELVAGQDWVVLDTDVTACPPEEIHRARVLEVGVAGHLVWQAE